MSSAELFAVAPAGLFLLGGLLCLLFEAAGTPVGARKQGPRTHVALLGLATCAAVFLQSVAAWEAASAPALAFEGMLVLDALGLLGTAAVALCLALVIAAAVPGLREREAEHGESYALLLFAGAALCLLAVARELITVAAATTFASVALVALCSVDRRAPQSTEAAVKLMQSTGVLLALLAFGAALRYGATGQSELCARGGEGAPALALVGALLVSVVLLTWIAAVPLHMVRVDVVHGAPPFIGALMASAVSVVGAVLLLRWLGCGTAALHTPEPLEIFLVGVALLTLIVPPLAALDQSRVGRVVAHLLIAQAGPVLVAALAADGTAAGLGPYLLAVAATMVAAIGAVVAQSFLERAGREGSTWEAWTGAGRLHPLFGLSLVWLWASLAGVPGTAGFAARLVVGQAAFAEGHDLLGLAVFAAPALAAAPVLRLTIFLFAKPPDRAIETVPSGWRAIVVGLTCLAVLAVGLFPMPLLELAATMRFAAP